MTLIGLDYVMYLSPDLVIFASNFSDFPPYSPIYNGHRVLTLEIYTPRNVFNNVCKFRKDPISSF